MWRWAELHRDRNYVVVASDEFKWEGADIHVSTVWLGMDHNFIGTEPPIIFETMIFGGEFDEYQWRYSTEEEAKAAHVVIVELVKTVKKESGE